MALEKFLRSFIMKRGEIVMKNILFRLLPVLLLPGCASDQSIPAVENLNLKQYMGTWYEIARLPNHFERGISGVSADYSLLPGGEVKVVNRGTKNDQKKSITGVARKRNQSGSGELEVSFFKPFFNSYRIIKLGPDYRYSIVMGRNRQMLWVLGRQKQLSKEDREEIMKFLKYHKFPVEKLIHSWHTKL